MAKSEGRLDWFKFNPGDFKHGTEEMTNEEVGAYMRLLCNAWQNMASDPIRNICGIRADERYITKVVLGCTIKEWEEIRERVLQNFKIEKGIWKGEEADFYVNKRLGKCRDEALDQSVLAKSAQEKSETSRLSKETANVAANVAKLLVPARPQEDVDSDVDSDKEQIERQKPSDSQSVLFQPRKRGEPGYFEQGQYTQYQNNPKKLFVLMRNLWQQFRGIGAACVRPNGWLDSTLEERNADVIIPAYELWIECEGANLKGQDASYPIQSFIRSNKKGKWTDLVCPPNNLEVKPLPVTAAEVKQESSIEQQARVLVQERFTAPVLEPVSEVSVDDFMGEK